jgi:hypothetical protein
MATFYYLFVKKSIPFTYFSYRYIATIIIATLVMMLIVFSIGVLHEGNTELTFKRFILQLFILCTLIYVFPILMDEKKSNVYEEAMLIICYIFAIQGLIHLCAYLIPPFGDFILSLRPEEFREAMLGRKIELFRWYALSGSIFFELPSAYGVAFILFVRLQLIEGQKYLTGYRSYIVLTLIVVGIFLTGRVGLVGIGAGIMLYFVCVKDPVTIFAHIVKNVVFFSPLLLIGWFFLLSPSQRSSIEAELFPYAFEMFYNLERTGKMSTASSDATFYAFYYPLNDDTLFWGEGTDDVYEVLDKYNFTDAGYMRSILIGGIPYLICLLIYQFLYFSMPIKMASRYREKENRDDKYCFLCLFFYILVLHVKDMALGTQYLSEVLFLYISFSYLIKYYTKLEK